MAASTCVIFAMRNKNDGPEIPLKEGARPAIGPLHEVDSVIARPLIPMAKQFTKRKTILLRQAHVW
jgi:hypothetical protein